MTDLLLHGILWMLVLHFLARYTTVIQATCWYLYMLPATKVRMYVREKWTLWKLKRNWNK